MQLGREEGTCSTAKVKFASSFLAVWGIAGKKELECSFKILLRMFARVRSFFADFLLAGLLIRRFEEFLCTCLLGLLSFRIWMHSDTYFFFGEGSISEASISQIRGRFSGSFASIFSLSREFWLSDWLYLTRCSQEFLLNFGSYLLLLLTAFVSLQGDICPSMIDGLGRSG